MAGGNHTITAIIAFPAEHQHPPGPGGKNHIGKRPARTLHELEFGNTQRYRIFFDSAHPGRRDDARLHSHIKLIGLHW
jgi:hypothetical protein